MVLAGLLFSTSLLAQSDEGSRILFVGNSYTYFNNLPQSVHLLGKSRDVNLVIAQSTAGGATWEQHWAGEKDLTTRELIVNGNWDYVVLQNHSLSTINDSARFMEYGKLLIDLVRQSGAEPVLYLTWAREFNPLMQARVTAVYESLAESEDCGLVPVGPIWSWMRSLRPSLGLYAKDQSHPSALGSYVTACVFFKFFSNQLCKDLPWRLQTIDAQGEKLYIAIIAPDDANFVHQAIDTFRMEMAE